MISKSKLLELTLVLTAVLVAAICAGRHGEHYGLNDAKRTTNGFTAGGAIAAVVAVYRTYRT